MRGEAQGARDMVYRSKRYTKSRQRSRVQGPHKSTKLARQLRLKFQESEGGNEWERGEKTESDN